jgi:cytidylate kinase
LGFKYLDTGVMYRAVTWLALERKVSTDNEEALAALAEAHPVRLASGSSDRVVIGGHIVGPELRDARVTGAVSLVSRVPSVRRALVRQQRLLGDEGNIVMAGRDIGTVVLPDADLKIFLSASPEIRARRRWHEMAARGQPVEFQQVLEETKTRDKIDSHRSDSPLRPAPDAFHLDSSGLSAEQVIDVVLKQIGKMSQPGAP